MPKLGKFFKFLDKIIFWFDFKKAKNGLLLLGIFVAIFFLSILLGPLVIVMISSFVQEVSR